MPQKENSIPKTRPALHEQHSTRKRRQHRHHRCAAARSRSHVCLNLDGRIQNLWLVVCWCARLDRAVPTVLLEALVAGIGHGGLGALEASGQHGAANTHWPVGVASRIALGDDVPAVGNDGISLVVCVRHLESRKVGLELVRVVGQIDNQGRSVRHVGRVAAEKDGLGVEPEVEESLSAGDVGESSAVGDFADCTLVRGNGRGAIGPAVGIGRRVDGKDNVDLALMQQMRVVGDVLQILATVHQSQSVVVEKGVGLVVPSLERIRRPVGNVVVVVAKRSQNTSENLDDEIGDAFGNDGVCAIVVLEVQDDLVKESAGSAHDVADIVESNKARFVFGQHTVVELGTGILERDVAIQSRIR